MATEGVIGDAVDRDGHPSMTGERSLIDGERRGRPSTAEGCITCGRGMGLFRDGRTTQVSSKFTDGFTRGSPDNRERLDSEKNGRT